MLQYTNFGRTKKIFAMDPSTFCASQDSRTGVYSYQAAAVWLGRRKATNRAAAFKGFATAYSQSILTYNEFIQVCDRFYGGEIWDGEEVWGATKLSEQIAIAAYLDPILQAGPNLLPQFDGWFEIVKPPKNAA